MNMGRRMWACKVGNGFNGCEKMKKMNMVTNLVGMKDA